MNAPVVTDTSKDVELLAQLADGRAKVLAQVGHVIIGQREVLNGILTAVLAGGHALLVGVPGLAKTLMVQTLAESLALKFSRIQFTPDLMPSDITGTEILEEDHATGKRAFKFVRGPIFANVILADEINRTPPKTQAALLQAMQEHEVTAAGTTYPLPNPFFVLATQNPIEQEGTYPLPEAQLDRFMLQLMVEYPSQSEEEQIVATTTGEPDVKPQPIWGADTLVEMQHLVRRIPVPTAVVKAAVRLARMTRPATDAPAVVNEYIEWGAGPRASQYLVLGAKAQAALDGRPMADLDDVKTVALATLRHRVMANFSAEAAGRSAADVCTELIDAESWMD